MSKQAKQPTAGKAVYSTPPAKQEQSAAHSSLLQKFQSIIKQLDSKTPYLSKEVEECYDYIELHEYLDRKKQKKMEKLKRAQYSPKKRRSVIGISAPLLKGLMILALGLYVLLLFI